MDTLICKDRTALKSLSRSMDWPEWITDFRPPKGAKVLILSIYGVAYIGAVRDCDINFIKGWLPLPPDIGKGEKYETSN